MLDRTFYAIIITWIIVAALIAYTVASLNAGSWIPGFLELATAGIKLH